MARGKTLIDSYEKRKDIVPNRIYWDQCSSSKKRGHNPPEYTKQELYNWIIKQPNYNKLYTAWVNSNYLSDFKPSVDRLDNSLGYSFDNIELVTFRENLERACADRISGDLLTTHREVHQYSRDGQYMQSFHSEAEAARQIYNGDQQNISAACYEKIAHSAGFQWRFFKQATIEPCRIFNNWKHDQIYQYNAISGDLIDIYPSAQYIKEHTKFDMNHIRHSKRDKNITHHNSTWDIVFLTSSLAKSIRTTNIRTKIIQLDKVTKEKINIFNSMSEAEHQTGVKNGNISKCCNKKTKTAGGYIWERLTT